MREIHWHTNQDEFLDNVKKESNPVVKYEGFEFPPAQNTPQNVRYFKDFDYKAKPDSDDKSYTV